jgi:hypothetical protein
LTSYRVTLFSDHLNPEGKWFLWSIRMVWNMQKSAIEEINKLRARLESITEQAKTEALDQASEAIGFLRVLGLDNDTILRELGFRGRAKAESREGTPPKDEPCQICHFRTAPPMTEEHTVVSQRRSLSHPKSFNKRA